MEQLSEIADRLGMTVPFMIGAAIAIAVALWFAWSFLKGGQSKTAGGEKSKAARKSKARTPAASVSRSESPATVVGARDKEQTEKALAKLVQAEKFGEAAPLALALGKKDVAAGLFERAGKYGEAADLLEQIRQFEPAAKLHMRAGAYAKAATLYERLGRFEEAAECYAKDEDYRAAAELYVKKREFPKAAEQYAKVSAKIVKELTTGDISDKRRKFLQKVGADAGKVFEHVGNLSEAADLYRAAGDVEQSAKLAKKMGRTGDGADVLIKAGRVDEAIALLREAGEVERADRLQAKQLENDGQYDEAGELYAKLGEWTSAAELFSMVGQPGRAAELMEKAGSFADAGNYYLKAKNGQRAAACFERAKLYDKAAILYQKFNKDDKALDMFARALADRDVHTSNLDSFYNYGVLLQNAGDTAAATAIYDKIVRFDKEFRDVAKRLRALQPEAEAVNQVAQKTESAGKKRRYVMLDELGRGGMGVVYKAMDRTLDRVVAFKVLPADVRGNKTLVDNFFREAKSAAALNHPNIVTVFDAGEEDDVYYIAMEYIEGRTLKQIVKESGPFPVQHWLLVFGQVCRALDYAHNQKIVHRDIKPSNLMWLERDKVVKITDFGLAKVMQEVSNFQTVIGGTPHYMSPEQILGGEVDRRADLYSLGASMYELATGSVPYPTGDAGYHHIHSPVPDVLQVRPDFPTGLALILKKCMDKEPSGRYRTANDVLAALQEARPQS